MTTITPVTITATDASPGPPIRIADRPPITGALERSDLRAPYTTAVAFCDPETQL